MVALEGDQTPHPIDELAPEGTVRDPGAVHEALRGVGRELMRNHLKHCAANAIRGGEEQAEVMYDELVEMMYKHIR